MALGSDVHLYNAEAGVASTLCSLAEDDYVTSLSWSADGRHLAIGTYSHQVRPRPTAFELKAAPVSACSSPVHDTAAQERCKTQQQSKAGITVFVRDHFSFLVHF